MPKLTPSIVFIHLMSINNFYFIYPQIFSNSEILWIGLCINLNFYSRLILLDNLVENYLAVVAAVTQGPRHKN